MIMIQNINGLLPYVDPQTGRAEVANIVRSKAESGVSSVDAIHLIQTSKKYLQKALMSVDGIFAPYATTDVMEGFLLEAVLRSEIAKRNGGEFTEGDAQALAQEILAYGTLNIPHFKKPTNTRSTMSASGGPTFSSQEALQAYNEQGVTPDI